MDLRYKRSKRNKFSLNLQFSMLKLAFDTCESCIWCTRWAIRRHHYSSSPIINNQFMFNWVITQDRTKTNLLVQTLAEASRNLTARITWDPFVYAVCFEQGSARRTTRWNKFLESEVNRQRIILSNLENSYKTEGNTQSRQRFREADNWLVVMCILEVLNIDPLKD